MHQSTLSAEAQGKLGAPQAGRARLLPVVAHLGSRLGARAGGARRRGRGVARRARGSAGCSCPRRSLFLAFMGLQGRYFGRWLLPIFPILCLLAAFFALRLAGAIARRRVARRGARPARRADRLARLRAGRARASRARRGAARAGARLQRPLGPRALARRHAQPDARVDGRARPARARRSWSSRSRPTNGRAKRARTSTAGNRLSLVKYPSLLSRDLRRRRARAGTGRARSASRTTSARSAPALIGYYERHGYCWVVSGSTQSGRAFADPQRGAAGDRLLPRARRAGRSRLPRLALRARARARSRSTSTGASTTTRSPTSGRGRR